MHFSLGEIVFLLVLALVVVGPGKLPEVARQMGKYVGEFKRASNEFRRQLETEMLNIELEERAKKRAQEEVQLPPAQSPSPADAREAWQEKIRPAEGSVSRNAVDPQPEALSASASAEPASSAGVQ